MSKLWGGCFEKDTNKAVEEFTTSIHVDSRLWEADITGSIAHARMLGKTGVLSAEESSKIVGGLEALKLEISQNPALIRTTAEDVHSEIERLLGEKVGSVAGKLHTARSRNDQVATATRLYLRGQVDLFSEELGLLQNWIVEAAEKNLETVLPGFTHMQHAQPVSLAHHLLAYFWMFARDRQRLTDLRKRVNVSPLGSAALAGTSFPIDRKMTAAELGFEQVAQNSLDAVSDRDFVVEFLAAASLVMSHLSRLSEELILWSTPEFGFVELDDSVTTGSSIMPQKKNPDVAELIRGKVGRVTGNLMAALTLLKGLPLSYNRDLQEDKAFLFEGLDTATSSVRLMRIMLENSKFNAVRMAAALNGDFSNATDLADYLVRKGLTFRQSHEIAGSVVKVCLSRKIGIEDLTLKDLQAQSPLFESDILDRISPVAVMKARTSEGGTSPQSVKLQIQNAKLVLNN
jgi:argininosuccinate lyase